MSAASAHTSLEQQDSALLRLPAELRNDLYTLVCNDIAEATIIYHTHALGIVGSTHPLSQACRQTLHEFSPIFVEAAKKTAVNLVIHTKNFDLPPRRQMLVWLTSLPHLPHRKITQRVFIDNAFDQGFDTKVQHVLCAPRAYVRQPHLDFQVDVHFDSLTFDIAHLKAILKKANLKAREW